VFAAPLAKESGFSPASVAASIDLFLASGCFGCAIRNDLIAEKLLGNDRGIVDRQADKGDCESPCSSFFFD
jgi:hypothetical protein